MDLEVLKNKIKEEDLIPKLLEDFGCERITKSSNGYRSTTPDGNNPTALNVSLENLFFSAYSDNFFGNIFAFIMHYKKVDFINAIYYLCELTNIKYEYEEKEQKPKKSPANIFEKVKKKSKEKNDIDIEVEFSNKKRYFSRLHIDWIHEGINTYAKERFSLMYDYKTKSMIIPHRKWNTGKIVGIINRNMTYVRGVSNFPKYYSLVPYNKRNNIYGLYENYLEIQMHKNVFVFESEKSVLKRSSKKDNTCVATCGKNMTKEQIKILIGLNVDITLCYDNDVDIYEIYSVCDEFYGIRNIYYTTNYNNILGKKDCAADVSNKEYSDIINNKIKYDYKEKNKFEKLKIKKEKKDKKEKEDWLDYE